MALLLDIFNFLSVILRGAGNAAQALALGGIAFVLLLAGPLAGQLGAAGPEIFREILRVSRRWTGWSALGLALIQAASLAAEASVLVGTAEIPPIEVLGASFFVAGSIRIAAALGIAVIALVWTGSKRPVRWLLPLALALVVLAASTMTTHAFGRLDGRAWLLVASLLHQAGAAVWIGGIPYLLMALSRCRGDTQALAVAARFSLVAIFAVAALAVAGSVMSMAYIGTPEAVYGTPYGLMVGSKVLTFAGLLFLGAMNFFTVRYLKRDRSASMARLHRFAEVEIGVGITVLFAAASLTSQPPAVDLPNERVSFSEIIQRLTPSWPRLISPDHDELQLSILQSRLDAQAAATGTAAPSAYVPGAGTPPPLNAQDIAWSEYNHNWSGMLVLAIGLLALAERTGRATWARHWPLLFIALAAFLLVRADAESWPLGHIGFMDSLRDPEVTQHRLFMLLIVAFGLFEWRVRTGSIASRGAALVFPLVTAVGGALLLTHSHSLVNIRQELLLEVTHAPLAQLGITAGWARWLELRLDSDLESHERRIAGWIWPVCFVLVGLLLLFYRES